MLYRSSVEVKQEITSSYAETASYALNVPITASYALTASYAIIICRDYKRSNSSYAETASYAISTTVSILWISQAELET